MGASAPPQNTCRWVIHCHGPSAGMVKINNDYYHFRKLRDGEGRLLGYRLQKLTEQVLGDAYDLPADLSTCDCPDAIYREHDRPACKHQRALRVLLRSADVG